MIASIRTFLLVNLLVSLTLVASMGVIGNIFLEHQNFQTHLDSQLSLSAYTMDAFLDQNIEPEDLSKLQKHITNIPFKVNTLHYDNLQQEHLMSALLKSVQYHIWDKNDRLILTSFSPPSFDLSNAVPGFSSLWESSDKKIPWRRFVLHNNKTGYTVAVYQREDIRDDLEHRITQNSVTMMILSYPFLALMIWIVVRKALDSLYRITRAIRRRKPHQLGALRIDAAIPSEVRPLIEEINLLFKRLRDTFAREKRFASDAAHELRTPLAAVNAHAQIALHEEDMEKRNASIQKLLTSVKRSTHVVQQLLTLSRMVPEAGLAETEPVNLYTVAQHVLSEIAPLAVEKDITLALEGNKRTLIDGNATACGILIRNLTDNAIRYTPENGEVTLSIQERKGEVILRVQDSGPGIPPNLRNRIFERFFRAVGNQASGSGLGLSIVAQIAQLHKASIRLAGPRQGTGLIIEVRFNSLPK